MVSFPSVLAAPRISFDTSWALAPAAKAASPAIPIASAILRIMSARPPLNAGSSLYFMVRSLRLTRENQEDSEMAKDFRQFLEQLERDSPLEVIRIKKPVDPAAFELTALLVHLERQGKFPGLLLEQPLNLKSERAPFHFASNLYALRQRCAPALGLRPADRALPPTQTGKTRGRRGGGGRPRPAATSAAPPPPFYPAPPTAPAWGGAASAKTGAIGGEPPPPTPPQSFGDAPLAPADAELIIEG